MTTSGLKKFEHLGPGEFLASASAISTNTSGNAEV
jgi:hypothetical protein